jgi:CheY-like chemotaxis protein
MTKPWRGTVWCACSERRRQLRGGGRGRERPDALSKVATLLRPMWSCWISACRSWTALPAPRSCRACPIRPAVIFITAFDEHALAAFQVEAIGYLLKPVRRDQLATRRCRAPPASTAPSCRHIKQANDDGKPGGRPQPHYRPHPSRSGAHCRWTKCYYFLADQKYVTVRHTKGDGADRRDPEGTGNRVWRPLYPRPPQRPCWRWSFWTDWSWCRRASIRCA